MRTLLATSCILLAAIGPASAQRGVDMHARTAGDLAQLCAADPRSPMGDAQINYCHGFAQGVADTMLGMGGSNRPFCFPMPPPTRTATLAQFVSWAKANPGNASMPAALGLATFLRQQFPCR